MSPPPLRAVLFDLDGTLIDSAPDLAGAANRLRTRRGLPALPFASLRPMVGAGARGMVGLALGCGPDDPAFISLRDEFLADYENNLLRDTRVFDGIATVLAALEAKQLPWGIVTNKARRFTQPIADGLGLSQRAATVICGDTTPHSKPHPAPLQEAARQLNLPPPQIAYVGDDLRDMQAARAAGMVAVAASWGYLGQGAPVNDWGADFICTQPDSLLKTLNLD